MTSMSGSSANSAMSTSSHSHLDSLPYELQLHIASFLPARALTKTLARINGHWRDLTDREVKRRIVQVLGEPIFARQEEEEAQATPSSSRTRAQSGGLASSSTSPIRRPQSSIQQKENLTIFFEAQRPIDTVTKRHPLHFGHFGEFQGPCQHLDQGNGTSSAASSSTTLKGSTTCCFHFDDGVAGRGSARGRSKGRAQASQTTSAGGEQGAATTARRRGVASELLSRMREEHHTSSVEVSRSRSPPEDYQAIAAAVIASAGLPQEEGQRSRGALAGGGFATMFTSSVAADEDDEDQQDDSAEAQEDIDRPLDAYDWAGPVSSLVADGNDDAAMTGETLTSARNWSDVAGSGRLDAPASVMISSSDPSTIAGPSHTKGKKQKKRAPTYRMQLDPLDSFETWILTLTMSLSQPVYEPPTLYPSLGLSSIDIDGQEPTTHDSLQRKWEEEGAMDFSQGVRGKDGSWTVRTLRSEKRLAEGLDRIYRDWFQAPAPTMDDVKGKAKQQQQPGSLELNLGDGIQLPTAELLSTFGAVNLSLARLDSSGSSLSSSLPVQRSLEIDSTNSTHLHLQPLPLPQAPASRDDNNKGASNSPSSHDAFLSLASLPSHQRMAAHAATLSPPSSSSAPPSTPPWSSTNLDPYWRSATHEDFSSYNRRHRVEVQFEARRIEIIAAKWLAAWEEWREEEERIQAERGGGGASQVIKASGSSWDLPGNVRQGGRFGLPNANRLAQTRFL